MSAKETEGTWLPTPGHLGSTQNIRCYQNLCHLIRCLQEFLYLHKELQVLHLPKRLSDFSVLPKGLQNCPHLNRGMHKMFHLLKIFCTFQLHGRQIQDFLQLFNILHKDPQLSQGTLDFSYLARNLKNLFVLHHQMQDIAHLYWVLGSILYLLQWFQKLFHLFKSPRNFPGQKRELCPCKLLFSPTKEMYKIQQMPQGYGHNMKNHRVLQAICHK